MKLSEFIQLMYGFIGHEKSQARYAVYIFSIFESEPNEGEKNLEDESGKYNPLYVMDESSQRRIFNGKLRLGKEKAAAVKRHINDKDFVDAIYALEDKQKELLIEELDKYGFKATAKNVDDVCADIFIRLIDALAEGKDFISPDEFRRRDSKGRLLTEVPLPTAYVENGKLHVGGETVDLPDKIIVSNDIKPEEQPYIAALCDAFSATLNQKVTPDTIDSLPKRYRRSFNDQRNYYNNAAWLEHSVREIYDDEGEDQFQILKEDAYEGIKETYFAKYENGYERLTHVLIKITSTTLNKSTLSHIKNLIGNLEKKGICHILVNDGTIVSWVDPDAE